jgi:peptidoglycan hydrolase-like protein with peptidoglycan-binding domain
MKPTLRYGSSGQAVKALQAALNARLAQLSPLAVDGLFGPKTLAGVKAFQASQGLKADGIVGTLTWGRLDAPPPAPDTGEGASCCNGDPDTQGLRQMVAQAFIAEFGAATQSMPSDVAQQQNFGFQLPGAVKTGGASTPGVATAVAAMLKKFRKLTPAQIATASTVYGNSIDFTWVFLSTHTGAYNRPFTAVVPLTVLGVGVTAWVLNCGSFAPSNNLLIHELAHVWQSQHHFAKAQFMAASSACQVSARLFNTAAGHTHPSVKTHKEFPDDYPGSAYAYRVPVGSFGDYGAEQIAQMIERGVPSIRLWARATVQHAVDPANVASLARLSAHDDRRHPDVKT